MQDAGRNPKAFLIHLEPLAQSVEHLAFNQRVGGSNPPWLIKINKTTLAKYDMEKNKVYFDGNLVYLHYQLFFYIIDTVVLYHDIKDA